MTKRGRYSSILGLISAILIINSTGCQAAPAPATAMEPTSTPTRATVTAKASATRTPTPANTPTRIPAFTSSATSTLTKTPSFIDISESTPAQPQSNYQLRSWSEDYTNDVVHEFLVQNAYEETSPPNIQTARITLEGERLLRYPDSHDWFSWAWELGLIDYNGLSLAEVRSGKSYFSFLLEHVLNNEKIGIEDFTTYSKQLSLLDEDFRSFSSYEQFTIKNLFGDNQEAYVCIVNASPYNDIFQFSGIFVIHKQGDSYRVEDLDDWHVYNTNGAYHASDTLDVSEDINGNGIPEAVIESIGGFGLLTGGESYFAFIKIYEWDPKQQAFTLYDYPILERPWRKSESNYLVSWDWQLGPSESDGTHPLLISLKIDENAGAIGSPVREINTSHPWSEIRLYKKNNKFPSTGSSNILGKADRRIQQLLFHDHNFHAAAIYMQSLIYNLDPESKPNKYSEYPYFHYLLGLSYELDGQPEKAAAAYYELWQKYPEDSFGILAHLKLDQK